MKKTYNIRLSEVQIEVYKNNARFKSVVAGRRTGKTVLAVSELNKVLLSRKNANGIYITSTYTQARKNFFNVYLEHTPKQVIKKIYRSSPQSIELINGSVVSLYGANNYDAIRGEGFDVAVLDEVADIPKEAWAEVIRPALSDREGSAFFIGTPKGKNNWFYDVHTDGIFIPFTYKTIDGGFVSVAEINEARKQLDERTFRQEYEATFETTEGLVIYNYSTKNHSNYTYNSNKKTVLCWDFNINPASCIINQEISTNVWCAVKEFYYPNTSTQVMIEVINEYLDKNGRPLDMEVTGDYSGHQRRSSAGSYTDWILIQQGFGVMIKVKQGRIKDRINALTSIILSSTNNIIQYINTTECKNLDKDLKKVTWSKNGIELDSQNGKIGHLLDALSYFATNYYPIKNEVTGSVY